MDAVVETRGWGKRLERCVCGGVVWLLACLTQVAVLDEFACVGEHREPGEGVRDAGDCFGYIAVASQGRVMREF